MSRFFIELSYHGKNYSGFQVQKNANSIQAEVEKALSILLKEKIILTGSSRTDTGVHALQNYFHFDAPIQADNAFLESSSFIYKLNAILPKDISIRSLQPVRADANCRFDAISREYKYYLSRIKNPFWNDRSYFFPYKLNIDAMQQAASLIMTYEDFTSFSKRNTQAKTFVCKITESKWIIKENILIYQVTGNRFLRGMVRALTATMLKVGRGKLSVQEFKNTIEARDCTRASFAVPAEGLFLVAVNYPLNYFI